MPALKIEVVADVVCPWCYLGYARLKEALKLRPDIKADISWRAYQLGPDLPAEGGDYKKLMAQKFDPARMAEIQSHMKEMGADLGLDFNFDKITLSPNTNAAHRLIYWAAEEGKLEAVAMGVMHAYFTEGKFIGDLKILTDIAEAAGMDRAVVERKFRDHEGKDRIATDLAKNDAEAVHAVPYYIIGGKVRVEGSLPPEDLAEEIDKALQKAA